MASSDVDQKWLGRLATNIGTSNAVLSSSLYQILGLSVLLSRKLYRARKLRKLDTSRDTKSLSLYQHIIWLSREGLNIMETFIMHQTSDGQYGPECRVLTAKLRASFFHIFCLFHNTPPVTQPGNIPLQASTTSLSPADALRNGNGATDNSPASRKEKQARLRDQIPSMTSEASYITNPYAVGGPVGTPSPAPPPGLSVSPRIPQPLGFLLPPIDYLPITMAHFNAATTIASQLLPGSHPLRLSVALEHAAFLWDCLHEHENARRLARRAIRDVYRAQEGMDDSEFEDAAELVGVLGRMMRRRSWEGTPRAGEGSGGSATDVRSPGSSGEKVNRNGAPVGGGGLGLSGAGAMPVAQSNVTTGNSPTSTRRSGSSGQRGSGGSRNSGSSKNSPVTINKNSPNSRSSSDKYTTPRMGPAGSKETTPRIGGGSKEPSPRTATASKETTPRAETNRVSGSSGSSTTPRAPQVQWPSNSPTTPKTTTNPYMKQRPLQKSPRRS